MSAEYLFVSGAPPSLLTELQALCSAEEGLSARWGQDALGRERCTLTLSAPSPSAVAALRERVHRHCRARGWRSFTV